MKIWPISTLTNPHAPGLSYFVTALLVAIVPASAIGIVLQLVLDPSALQAVEDAVLPEGIPFSVLFFGIVVFAPVVETLMMVVIFAVCRFFHLSVPAMILVQVVIWAALHGLQAYAWAFAPAWLFFVFSIVWLTQRQRSATRAFVFTSGVHATNNLIPMLAILAERSAP